MFANPRSGLLAAAGILFLAVPAQSQPVAPIAARPAPGQAAKLPKVSVRCVAPGSNRPVACAGSPAGSDIELLAAGALSDAPPVVTLREVSSGRQQRLQLKWFVDQGMAVKARIPASRQLCPANAAGQRLQFEIQVATSDMNQAQSGTADSVGFFQMRC